MAAGPQPADTDNYFHFMPTIWLMTASTRDAPTAPYLQDTDIHPIFQEDNWTRPTGTPMRDEYGVTTYRKPWEDIGPALRLASKFLTTDACLSWWTTLCLSEVTNDPATQRRYLPQIASTPHTRARVRQALLDLAPSVRFRFADIGDYTYATHKRQNNLSIITLQVDHLLYLIPPENADSSVLSAFARAHESRRLSFFTHLAMTLVHEVAHAVCRTSYAAEILTERFHEPFHGLTEPENEVGVSWENFLFRGRTGSLNGLCSASKGLVWWQWHQGQGHPASGALRENWYWGVYMVWIEALFEELTWRKVERLGLKEIKMRTCGDRARASFDRDGWIYEEYGTGSLE